MIAATALLLFGLFHVFNLLDCQPRRPQPLRSWAIEIVFTCIFVGASIVLLAFAFEPLQFGGRNPFFPSICYQADAIIRHIGFSPFFSIMHSIPTDP